MELHEYDRWIARLTAWAEAETGVIGLVALGSTAGTSHPPDEHSDHDLFVVTCEGEAGRLRADFGWLPEAERIVMVHVETEHGRGVVYDDGHLVEVAVFDDHELELARVNAHRVLVDGADITARLAAIAERTAAERSVDDVDGSYRLHSFVSHLIVGAGRYARGERLSANERIRGAAARALLGLLAEHVPADHPDRFDSLDPHRRFEQAFPGLGARLADAVDLPLPDAAAELLAVAEEHLVGRLPSATPEVVAAVRAVLARARAA